MDVVHEASQLTMEQANGSKEEGILVMPTAIPDPPETGAVEAMRTGKGKPPQNAGIVARKTTRRASTGRSTPIQRKPDPDPDKPKKETGSDHTTSKDPKKSERG